MLARLWMFIKAPSDAVAPDPPRDAGPGLYLDGLGEDFRTLKSDPDGWRDELEERSLWECTLGDGLRESGGCAREVRTSTVLPDCQELSDDEP